MPLFQVERYLAGSGTAALQEIVARATKASEEMTAEGVPVRYVRCTLAPEDEMCFCLFDGPSIGAIEETNRRASLSYERITAVVDIEARHPTGGKS